MFTQFLNQQLALKVIPPCALLCAGIAVYSNTLNVPFLLDDSARIVDEPAIRTVWPPSVAMAHSNRPFASYTFAINYALHGLDVRGYHVLNLVIHLLAGLCLLGIVRRTLQQTAEYPSPHAELTATAIALIWVVHPLQTQAVTYIVQRLESLMGLAYLATLYFFVRAQGSRLPTVWYLFSWAACAFGMGCKEVMVTAPVILMWYDRVFIATTWSELIAKRKWFYGLLSGTWLVLAWAMLHDTRDYTSGALIQVEGLTPWTYLLSQTAVVTHYLQLSVWPDRLCFYHDWPTAHGLIDVWPQATFLTVLLLATLGCIAKFRRWSFLGGCFFLILAPSSSMVPIQDLAFEHRMYLPLAAVITAFVFTLTLINTKLAYMVASVAVIALGNATFHRNSTYQSEVSIWTDTLIYYPQNVKVLTFLGNLHADTKQHQEARKYFERALAIEPTHVRANVHYAGLLMDLGEFQAARQRLTVALRIQPKNTAALANLGSLYFRTGMILEAIKCYQRALEMAPSSHELRISLTATLLACERYDEARRNCQIILSAEPESVDALINLACAEQGLGRKAEAIRHCQTALALAPENPNVHANLAMFVSADDRDQAIWHLRKACQLAPDSGDYHLALADLIVEQSPQAAVTYYEAALRANPSLLEAHLSLAELHEQAGKLPQAISHLEAVAKIRPDWRGIHSKLHQLRKANRAN